MEKQTEPVRRAWGVDEASRMYGVSGAFLRSKIRTGELRALKVGRRMLILERDLVEFFEGARVVEAAAAEADGKG